MVRRRRKRILFSESGNPVRVGFDDPLRWALFRLRRVAILARTHPSSPFLLVSAFLLVTCISVVLLSPSWQALPALRATAVRAELSGRKGGERVEGKGRADPRMVERVVAHLPVLQENIALAPPFQIINGQSFSNAELSMRLAAISGPERDAVCVADNGDLWACGLAARATLSNLIQTTALNCDAVAGPRRHVEGSCRLPDKASLAARLVALGFARPAQPGHFEVELTEARRHRRGLWNGDWTVRAASPSFVAGQTLPSQASVP